MGNALSTQWKIWLAEYGFATIAYIAIFYRTYSSIKKRKNYTIQDAMSFGTDTISQINAIICILMGSSIFYYKLWKDPVVKDIGLRIPFHNQSLFISYLTADLISLLTVYLKHKKDVKLRIDIMLHHIFAIIPFCLWAIPNPKYYWTVLSQCPGLSEVSTIFLNLVSFSRFLNDPDAAKKLRKVSKLCFIITWFTVRMPLMFIVIAYTIAHWKEIEKEYPEYIKYSIIIMWILMGALQLVWTVGIAFKIIKYCKMKPVGHANMIVHGQQMQLTSLKD
eukprot:156679_1